MFLSENLSSLSSVLDDVELCGFVVTRCFAVVGGFSFFPLFFRREAFEDDDDDDTHWLLLS